MPHMPAEASPGCASMPDRKSSRVTKSCATHLETIYLGRPVSTVLKETMCGVEWW